MSLRVTCWVSSVRGEGEGVPVHFKDSYLIGTRPHFVPRDIDVVDHLTGLYRVPARVREHRVVERYSLVVRWSGGGRHYPTACGSDRLHTTIG